MQEEKVLNHPKNEKGTRWIDIATLAAGAYLGFVLGCVAIQLVSQAELSVPKWVAGLTIVGSSLGGGYAGHRANQLTH
jgi:hypothetical protein